MANEKQPKEPEVAVLFTQQRMNILMNALMSRPYGEVAELVTHIQRSLAENQQGMTGGRPSGAPPAA